MATLGEFLSPEAGQKRRAWLNETLGYYLPPELRGWVGAGAELNPVTNMERASVSAKRVADPNLSGWDRMAAAGDVATNMGAVLAPVAGAKLAGTAGVDGANAIVEALTAASPMKGAVDDFLVDEFGGMRLWHATNGPEFDVFDPARIGSSTDEGFLGSGGYFSTDANIGRSKRTKMEFDADPQNPLRLASTSWADDKKALVRSALGLDGNAPQSAVDAALEKAGYDSVILDYSPLGYNEQEVMLRDPTRAIRVKPAVSDPIAERGATVMDMLRSGRGAEVTDEMLDMGDPVQNARLNEWLFNNYDLPMDAASRAARAGEMTNADAFHATGSDFAGFKPSQMRGASFFAPTPDGALKGAAASATEGWGTGSNAVIPVRLNTTGVEGLGRYRDPRLNAFADSLENRLFSETEMDAAIAEADLPAYANWTYLFDDLTDYEGLGAAMDAGKDTAPFIKFAPKARPIPYGPTIERGLDGWQFAHYQEGMSEAPISRGVTERGNTGFVMMDEGGASIAMTDPRNIRSRFARFDPRLAHLRNLSAGLGLPLAAYLGMPQDPMASYLEAQ